MPNLFNEHASIVSNECVYGRLNVMVLKAPNLSSALEPGQFVHMKISGMLDHVLRRPFSVYSWNREQGTIEILYQTVGAGSSHMATLKAGEEAELIGPIGNVWLSTQGDLKPKRVLLVGGGVGAAPLFEFYRALVEKGVETHAVLGAQTKDALVALERYKAVCGKEPFCSTDDGSYGYAGFATGLVEELLDADKASYDYVAVCGPAPLMRIVSSVVIDRGIACEVSLEKRMACGIGACLSCVCDTKSHGRKRVCVDGPIFDAREVVW